MATGVVLVLGGIALVANSPATAEAFAAVPTPELAEREQRRCVTCHVAVGRGELNEAGAYYREHRSFENYPGELPERRPETGPAPQAPEAPEAPEVPEPEPESAPEPPESLFVR